VFFSLCYVLSLTQASRGAMGLVAETELPEGNSISRAISLLKEKVA